MAPTPHLVSGVSGLLLLGIKIGWASSLVQGLKSLPEGTVLSGELSTLYTLVSKLQVSLVPTCIPQSTKGTEGEHMAVC